MHAHSGTLWRERVSPSCIGTNTTKERSLLAEEMNRMSSTTNGIARSSHHKASSAHAPIKLCVTWHLLSMPPGTLHSFMERICVRMDIFIKQNWNDFETVTELPTYEAPVLGTARDDTLIRWRQRETPIWSFGWRPTEKRFNAIYLNFQFIAFIELSLQRLDWTGSHFLADFNVMLWFHVWISTFDWSSPWHPASYLNQFHAFLWK